MGLSVWAESPDVPGLVCSDARLRGGEVTALSYPKGTHFGQAGWDMGLQFTSLADLANKLTYNPEKTPKHICGNWVWACSPIKKGQVTRLGIHAHGLPGKLYLGGKKREDLALTLNNIDINHNEIHAIGLSTSEKATILFLGCLAGQGEEGTEFLKKLSLVWPKRRVVAFTTIGFVSGGNQARSGTQPICNEPGMRDTKDTSPLLTWKQQQKTYGPLWRNLNELPWASETSPNAKIALNGNIVGKKPEIDFFTKKREMLPAWLDRELWRARRDPAKAMRMLRERESRGLYYYFPKRGPNSKDRNIAPHGGQSVRGKMLDQGSMGGNQQGPLGR